nr:dTDP-4-dehydrorhamnose reductase [uncultured Psychroserpens sp.]
MRSRVLVTGANGQLGKTLRDISGDFLDLIEFVFMEKAKLNITKHEDVILFFNENKFDYCINCAAYTNVDLAESETEKAMDINAFAVENLAICCYKHNTIFIHLSTDYVFDGNHTQPYTEYDKTNPINIYGKSKLLGEEFVRKHIENYFIIRTSWLYSKFNKNFVKTIFNKVQEDKNLNIITSQKGTPTSCVDLSNFIVFLVVNKIKKYGTYHFSAKGETTWYALGLYIANYYNSKSIITPIDTFNSKAKRPLYSVLSNRKAMLLTNETPKDWQDSVGFILKDLANN